MKTFEEKFKSVTAIEKQLLELVHEQIHELPTNIDVRMKFNKYMDSLDEVEFLMVVEKFFDIGIDDDEALKHNTIAKAAQLVNSKINGGSIPTPDEWFTPKIMEAPTGKTFNINVWGHLTDRQHKAIYALVKEREYQDKVWEESLLVREALNRPNEWLVYIQRYLNKAIMDKENNGTHCTMDNIRKIGAMCMAAMEQNEIVEREDETR